MCQAAQQLFQDLALLLTAKKKKEQVVEDKKAEKGGELTFVSCVLAPRPHTAQRSTFLSIKPTFLGGPEWRT